MLDTPELRKYTCDRMKLGHYHMELQTASNAIFAQAYLQHRAAVVRLN